MIMRRDRLSIFLTVGCVIFFLLYANSRQNQPRTLVSFLPYGKPESAKHCLDHPRSKDLVVVMKTGASEINHRLPVHFNTTFRCAADFLIFSDVAQEFQGVTVYDALDDLHTFVKPTNPDFNYYRELQAAAKNGTDVTGYNTQAAWDLDKWKNVPILRKALAMRPDAKWFLFIDADTAITWTNLLAWLSKMSHKKPHYIGAQIWIGDIEFAHGGSGYLVSQAAAKRVAAASKEKMHEWMNFVFGKCCGDLVIGKVFKDVGVPVTRAWPNVNGETPQSLDYSINHWCYAAVTWHHMSDEQNRAMFEYDKNVIGKMTPRYADVFEEFVRPYMTDEREDWDNVSTDEKVEEASENLPEEKKNAWKTFEDCKEACKAWDECKQFSFKPGQCGLSKVSRLGHETKPSEQVKSGWFLDRIDAFRAKNSGCAPIFITK